jgi:hypothetical protein
MLDVTSSGYAVGPMLGQALTRALRDLVPWLLIWLFVTPALQRLPWAQPWLALLASAAFAIALVPLMLGIEHLTGLQLGAMFLFAVALGLPVVRANDVWLVSMFFIGMHIVTVTVMGMPFGRIGEGIFAARLRGDALVTGGQMGPVFGFAGMLGQVWLASTVLTHQRLLFSGARARIEPRGAALRQLAIGGVLSAIGVTIFFGLTIATGHSVVQAVQPSAVTLSESLRSALPAAITLVIWPCLIAALVLPAVGRRWLAAIIATAVMVAIDAWSPGGNAFTMTSRGAMTLAVSLAFANTGRLWMPVGLAFAWLVCEGPIFGFPTNGFPIRHPWVQQEIRQYSLMSGGVIGPAASAFAIAAKSLVVLAVAFVTRATQPKGA